MVAVSTLIKAGCEHCPKSEDVWLEAARLHVSCIQMLKIVAEDEFMDAVEHLPRSTLGSVPEDNLLIMFSSLRRTNNEDIHKRLATELAEDEDHADREMGNPHPRSRGAILGLFDSPERRGRIISLMYLQDEDSDDIDDSKIFSRGVSPIASPLLMPQEPPGHIRSLGNELGSEYWNDQEGSTSEHRHTRTTSLLSLSALVDNTPSNRTTHSPSASPIESSPVPPSKRPTASSRQRSRSMRDKDRPSHTGTLDRSRSQLCSVIDLSSPKFLIESSGISSTNS